MGVSDFSVNSALNFNVLF